jgi:hypothetical protein
MSISRLNGQKIPCFWYCVCAKEKVCSVKGKYKERYSSQIQGDGTLRWLYNTSIYKKLYNVSKTKK